MAKTNTLRSYCIGNTILYNGKVAKLKVYHLCTNRHITPLHINTDNIQEVGFRAVPNKDNRPIFYAHGIHVEKTSEDEWIIEYETTRKLKYIHELENFVFFTTGEDIG